MNVGNTLTGQVRPYRVFRPSGNAQMADEIVQPGGHSALVHLNRFLATFRASNRRRRLRDAA